MREARSPAASVVIVNYNGERFLDELLTSLRAQTLDGFETLFVDNASTDASVQYVEEHYPWVQVLAQTENLGFAAACNLGARIARSEYVVFLNTDMLLDERWLQELVEIARHDPLVAAVSPKLRLYAERTKLNGVGGSMNYLGYTWDRGMFEEDTGQYDAPHYVLFASAGAALFRRRAFFAAGGFDERFFMYHEDVDLCWRLWLLGYRVVTAPRALAYHHFGGSTREARAADWRELIGERNNIRALIKNYELPNLVRALSDIARLPLTRRRRLQQWRNFAWNAFWLHETLRERRRLQRDRVRSDAELSALIHSGRRVLVAD